MNTECMTTATGFSYVLIYEANSAVTIRGLQCGGAYVFVPDPGAAEIQFMSRCLANSAEEKRKAY